MKITDPHALDLELVSVEKCIKLLWHLKPLNIDVERAAFLQGKRRNPVFRYPVLKFAPDSLREKLNNLKPDGTPLGLLFTKKILEIKLKINLLEARGKKEFTAFSAQLYGAPTMSLHDEALRILKNPHMGAHAHEKYSTEEVATILQNVLTEYGLLRWKVKIKDHLVSDIAAGKRNALFLLKDASFTRVRLDRIIAHEIETHILTAENGKYQPYQIFHRGFANYLETQEGLAIFAQECQKGCLPIAAHRISYLTLAVLEANKGSFRQVYEAMRGYRLSSEKSFRMALRAKRGLTDTESHGGFTKDIIYLKGYQRIEEFAQQGGDIKKLYLGKVALEDLPFISKIPYLVAPRYVPKWVTSAASQSA